MKIRHTTLALILVGAVALSGCSSKKQMPEEMSPKAPQESPMESPHGPIKKEKREIFLPDEVKKAWKGVTIEVTYRDKNVKKRFDVPLNSEFKIPDSTLTIKVGDFFPSFVIEGGKMTSASNKLENPATNVTIMDGSKVVFKGWLFANYPEVHPFEHDKYGITLIGGIPAKK